MELFSPEFFSALLAIVVIDLVLAGDNAIVIALAARNLPDHLRNKAVVWGTVGAIVVRTAMTVVVVWLLKIPGLLLAGGAMLLWIAYKLLINPDNGDAHKISSAGNFWSAMKTIVVADAVMGLDNVLAVAGAAHGNFLLVVLGLLISIPIVIWGSQLILKYVQRYPAIVYIGAGVLVWTGVKMMTTEPMVKAYFDGIGPFIWAVYGSVIGGVLFAGFRANRRKTEYPVLVHNASMGEMPASAPEGRQT
jgi:YjbE family integral membrane protein